MKSWLEYSFYQNTLGELILILLGIALGILVFIAIKGVALHWIRSRRTPENEKQFMALEHFLNKNAFPLLVVVLIYLSLNLLVLPPMATKVLNILLVASLASSAASALSAFLVGTFKKYAGEDAKDKPKENAIHWLAIFLKIGIWTTALVLFLDNMGVEISSLIAVLGIGGVAIAFAAQSILADFFCFFSIFFDKPYEIGDFVVVGTQSGTVENIGLKTTRLRALDGEQIVLANSDITKSRIHNYKTMKERRVVFHLGLAFETDSNKLELIPGMLAEIIDGQEGARFGRAHFVSFRDYCLDFEVAYFIDGDDYDEYLDLHHRINLMIVRVFQENGIQFAYPTRNVNLQMAEGFLMPGGPGTQY